MARRITAKYAGKCNACGGRFDAGDAIIWERGQGSQHADMGECAYYAEEASERAYFSQAEAAADWESQQDRMAEAEYQRGYHEVAQIQAFTTAGSALREQMYMEMEMAAYNRGED